MDARHPSHDIAGVLSLICTDIGAAAGLPNIDITKLTGSDVAASCTDDNVAVHNQKFGLSTKVAHGNSIKNEVMFLYTNPCLLDRDELFMHLENAVRKRGSQKDGESSRPPAGVEEESDERLSALIDEHNNNYAMHQQRNLHRANMKHAARLQQNKDLLTRLLMPHTLSTRFLLEMHHYISGLLTLIVAEESLHMIRNSIVTVPATFNHATRDLVNLRYLNEMCVNVETCANSVQTEALHAFFPPHYACWDKDNGLSHAMQPLLDCYARNDMVKPMDDSWHENIKRAHTMQDYTKLLRVEDILISMVCKGDNMVPVLAAADHSIESEVALMRFIVCVLFVIHIHNMSKRFCKSPLSFTRLDNPENIVVHSASSAHIYDIAPGRVFCHGGYLHVRPPDASRANSVLRSRCILSLCLRLAGD